MKIRRVSTRTRQHFSEFPDSSREYTLIHENLVRPVTSRRCNVSDTFLEAINEKRTDQA